MCLRLKTLLNSCANCETLWRFWAVSGAHLVSRDASSPSSSLPAFTFLDCRRHPDRWIRPTTWIWVDHFPHTSTNTGARICCIVCSVTALGQRSDAAVPISTSAARYLRVLTVSTWVVEPTNLHGPRLHSILPSTMYLTSRTSSAIPSPADPMG